MRETVRSVLESLPEIEVVGEAGNGRVAVQRARDSKPTVVIMDVIMPEMDGIEATRVITTEMPEIKVIGLSMHCDEGYRETLRQAGASGCVCKDSVFEELIRTVQAVVANATEWRSDQKHCVEGSP